MPKVVICDTIADEGVELLRARAEVVLVAGCGRDRLLAELAEADAAIVRSATELDSELLAAAPKLRVIARAGVGVDNVDLDCATRRGIAVVNTPTGNTIAASTAAMLPRSPPRQGMPSPPSSDRPGR